MAKFTGNRYTAFKGRSSAERLFTRPCSAVASALAFASPRPLRRHGRCAGEMSIISRFNRRVSGTPTFYREIYPSKDAAADWQAVTPVAGRLCCHVACGAAMNYLGLEQQDWRSFCCLRSRALWILRKRASPRSSHKDAHGTSVRLRKRRFSTTTCRFSSLK